MDIKTSLKKYLLINAIGFGLGGLLWGWILYSELPDLDYPFHFMAIIVMGLFGGISLVWFNKSIKNISKSVLAGFLGWGVGFIIAGIFVYPLYFSGIFILSIVPFINNPVGDKIFELINLKPDISIGAFWLVFLLTGSIIGLFYSLFLKTKKWPLIWRSGLGLGLASLIGPVIGNLIGNLFNSILISYLTTFSLIGIILGIFLSWGVYKWRV